MNGLAELPILEHFRSLNHRAKIPLELVSGPYCIRTTNTWSELLAVLKLRHQVFHLENCNRTLPSGLDIDEIDAVCDQLVIVCRNTGQTVGCYRLTSSQFSSHFYAGKRFHLEHFLASEGTKLELGRACIEASHRTGATLLLLWKGIAEYARQCGASTLFGSTSIRTQEPKEIAGVWNTLQKQGHVTDQYRIRPLPHAEVKGLRDCVEVASPPDSVFPPLFRSYLRAGAKVACMPAADPYMESTDFLTVLDLTQLADRMDRRYGRSSTCI